MKAIKSIFIILSLFVCGLSFGQNDSSIAFISKKNTARKWTSTLPSEAIIYTNDKHKIFCLIINKSDSMITALKFISNTQLNDTLNKYYQEIFSIQTNKTLTKTEKRKKLSQLEMKTNCKDTIFFKLSEVNKILIRKNEYSKKLKALALTSALASASAFGFGLIVLTDHARENDPAEKTLHINSSNAGAICVLGITGYILSYQWIWHHIQDKLIRTKKWK